jgi:hypothetical protein
LRSDGGSLHRRHEPLDVAGQIPQALAQLLDLFLLGEGGRRVYDLYNPAGSDQGFQPLKERTSLTRLPEHHAEELEGMNADDATDVDDLPQLEVEPTAEQAPKVGPSALVYEQFLDRASAQP